METATFSVDSASILLQVERHFSAGAESDSPGIVMGCRMIRVGLAQIAEHAIQAQDAKILAIMERLGAIHGAR